jgi:hypothetical protein
MGEPAAPDGVEWAFKVVASTLIAGIGAVVGWLSRTTMKNHEDIIALKAKQHEMEHARRDLEEKVTEHARQRLTVEDVRKVIEDALDRRDKQVVERRAEYERMRKLEIQSAVHDELERMLPRLAREIRGTGPGSGPYKLDPPGDHRRGERK